ncbi:Uu.00g037220.m01.CDS01 [Anthostomella pinea]|uniref:Uu.00g037220.m01.CDS01 n=1 Tax=Anthostomella pinea TaxID=933095 RepID=A0AAI8V9K2_9PEZI|nr:Uu.00g037220.m01.CDS01 [Anthostomella pinea]
MESSQDHHLPTIRVFRKAFTGSFKEATSGHVELHEQDEALVHEATSWLYVGDVAKKDEKTSLAFWVDLSMVGDYLGIESLRRFANSHFETMVENRKTEIFKQWNSVVRDPSKIDTKEIEDLFHAANVAYNMEASSSRFLRRTLLKFMLDTKYIAGVNAQFAARIADYPLFAADIRPTPPEVHWGSPMS